MLLQRLKDLVMGDQVETRPVRADEVELGMRLAPGGSQTEFHLSNVRRHGEIVTKVYADEDTGNVYVQGDEIGFVWTCRPDDVWQIVAE